MVRGGAHRSPVRKDAAFHRSFGTIAQQLPLLDYNYDVGKTLPDQNADGYFMGCRGYTLADIAGDEDGTIYQHQNTYDRMCRYEGHSTNLGGDVRDATTFGVVEGVLRVDETTDLEAESHRRGRPYSVDLVPGSDWFDSFRMALRIGKNPISVGTIWFPEWQNTPATGILSSMFVFDGKWDAEAGHNYKISGEKTIDGVPYLCAKTWQGKNFGDKGWCYFDRETFNKAFDIYGTIGLIQPKFKPDDILYTKWTILQHIVSLIGRFISQNLASKLPQNFN